jgi:anti-sigma factor RsiW
MISPQDFDRLSAYLDDDLSPAEKSGLEARLEREPELKAALDDLRMTVRALRALPSLKPPRNFTLTPAQAQAIRPRRILFPALRTAAAFAALALVFVIVGDLGSAALRPQPAAAPAGVAEKSAAPTEMSAPESAAQGADAALTPSAEAAFEIVAAQTPMVVATETASLAAPASTPAAEIAAGGADTLPPPSPTETADERQRAAETVTPTPATRTSEAAPVTETIPALALEPSGPPFIRYVEIGLALLTLGLALAAWLWRGR